MTGYTGQAAYENDSLEGDLIFALIVRLHHVAKIDYFSNYHNIFKIKRPKHMNIGRTRQFYLLLT